MSDERDITKREAQQWLDEWQDVSYLGHGDINHEVVVRMMQKIVKGEKEE
jgi:hypothetical protein|tara:strand:- start:481 stop:630 length:150 start_codon:yes stop_codon:yes gene_type:complete